jgi:hypothetical protein
MSPYQPLITNTDEKANHVIRGEQYGQVLTPCIDIRKQI